jgi:transposase
MPPHLAACLPPWIGDDRPAAGRSRVPGLRVTDMRKGMVGLAMLVQQGLAEDPFSGALFAFRGRRAGLIKLLWHDGIGLCMLTKKLEHGQFVWPPTTTTGRIALTPAQLTALLDGCEWRAPVARRRPELAGSSRRSHWSRFDGIDHDAVVQIDLAALPDDPATLQKMLRDVVTAAEQQHTTLQQRDAEIDKLHLLTKRLLRQQFGRRSEQLTAEQLQLALEDLEQTVAANEAAKDAAENKQRQRRETRPNRNHGALPAHLPRYEVMIDVEHRDCPCCGGAMHTIGELRSEQLDIVPAPRLGVTVEAWTAPTAAEAVSPSGGAALSASSRRLASSGPP